MSESVRIGGRLLEPGTRLKIAGERGTFRFIRYVTRPDGHCWLDVIGGLPGAAKFRSFRPERVITALESQEGS
uniref:DUF7246 family protein n=1 Tax=Catelliglobosispora koreensis TaxID=129052 RepID=UPI001B7FC005|nr:hypothetical protein [Catelliglobosispora koreensis]